MMTSPRTTPPPLTAPLWRAPALYHKTNGVSALYFLLRETSDGWVDGRIHLMKTCRVGYRRGPCTALGFHGNRCTCWIFFFALIWPRADRHVGVAKRKCVLPVSRGLSARFCCDATKKRNVFFFFFFLMQWLKSCLRSCVFVTYRGKTGPALGWRWAPLHPVCCLSKAFPG